MTVTTTANSITYAGNGTTTAFAFPYIFFAPSDLVVTLFNVAGNAYINPPPILNGLATYDYTVSGVVTLEYASGGTVTFNTAPVTGWTVSLVRVVPAIQTVTLIDNTKFPADTINTEFDYLTILAQQSLAAPAPPVAGPITQVVAGIGLSGGGTSGVVTLNLKPDAPGVVPIGAIVDFAGSVAPANWLLCQGQSLATAGTYGVLFTTIGYTYGGSGANFNLPDLGGRVTAGKEAAATRLTTAGSGVDGGTLGAAGGLQNHILTTAEMPAHIHGVNIGLNVTGAATPYSVYGDGTSATAQNSTSTGGGGPHTVTQPTMIMNKIIRFA